MEKTRAIVENISTENVLSWAIILAIVGIMFSLLLCAIVHKVKSHKRRFSTRRHVISLYLEKIAGRKLHSRRGSAVHVGVSVANIGVLRIYADNLFAYLIRLPLK
jgi:hypothetical protein